MKFTVKEWTPLKLYERRYQINFPVFQRGNIWFENQKSLLIDSIFRGIDIPKLYLQKTDEGWDCIDGHQRINTIVGFFDGDFKYNNTFFRNLTEDEKRVFENYPLTITEVTEISDEEVRILFIRLQLGIPVNSGEKLNAIKSNMGDFVKRMASHPFIKKVSVPSRRFAKEQVCAQICNNSILIRKNREFRNSKFEDLGNLYRLYKNFNLESEDAQFILQVLNKLDEVFSYKATRIRNRASIVSIYLMVEEMMYHNKLEGMEKELGEFYLEFLNRLKEEVNAGIDATNRFLIQYQSRIIQAADTKTSITERHKKLEDAFDYYLKYGQIINYT